MIVTIYFCHVNKVLCSIFIFIFWLNLHENVKHTVVLKHVFNEGSHQNVVKYNTISEPDPIGSLNPKSTSLCYCLTNESRRKRTMASIKRHAS